MIALIVTAPGVQDVEFVYPYYRLMEAGYAVEVAVHGFATPGEKAFQGIGGLWLPAHWGLPIPGTPHPDLVILPGGVKAMEKLRLEESLLQWLRGYHEAGGVIGSICSAAQLLISAKLVRGRMISCYPAMRVDLENAGATWHAGPVCDFDRIVSAPHYRDLGSWMAAVLAALARERRLADNA
jgi:protease I